MKLFHREQASWLGAEVLGKQDVSDEACWDLFDLALILGCWPKRFAYLATLWLVADSLVKKKRVGLD